MNKFFKVLHRSKYSKARLGEINTVHGVIKTPAFVPVATKGTIKALFPSLLSKIKIQVAFVNTYHLVSHPGVDFIRKAGGIHRWAKLKIPLMSDSGGFQVFSLAKIINARHRVFSTASPPLRGGSPRRLSQKQVSPHFQNKIRNADVRGEETPLVIKISDDGVKFRSIYDGQVIEFTPEKSIEYQIKIGADIIMAFDECTYYPAEYKYAKKAMERTHEWLIRCVKYFKNKLTGPVSDSFPPVLASKNTPRLRAVGTPFSPPQANILQEKQQSLYGIIQGATFEDLRKKSAKFVVSQNTDGVAIGGVSVGESKKEMRDQVRWVSDYLPSDRPVHLLGVGQFDDILDLVGYGIDTFDCVEPTRLARMGRLYKNIAGPVSDSLSASARFEKYPSTARCQGWTCPWRCRDPFLLATRNLRNQSFDLDIFKSKYKYDLSPVDENCDCYVCKNFTKSYLHHLFKQKEILGYDLATYHNLWVMERFFDKIRELIINNKI